MICDDFSIFGNGGCPPSWFLNFQKFNGQYVGGSKYAYPYQISLRSVEPLLRCDDFSILQDGGRRHLGFLIFFWNFNGQNAQEGRPASPSQIWSKSVKPRPRYGDFSMFQDGSRPPSWICYVCVRTTHEQHLVVFIAVQNLVGIDAIVLIICMFFCAHAFFTHGHSGNGRLNRF